MRQETYRFAFEEANAELCDILEQFEQLRSRKEQIEKVVTALQPFLEMGTVPETSSRESAASPQLEEEPAYFMQELMEPPVAETEFVQPLQMVEEETAEPIALSMEAEAEAEPEQLVTEMAADPFQRRIDDVLRHGVGGRELRIHSRSLNGLLSRV